MGQLAQVLREVTAPDERLLVGPQTLDDAGVILLGQGEGLPAGLELALVQTVDYFPPVVDDPYYYGAIAAANALSDVYAMGGRPHSALNIAGFPKDFPEQWTREILRGGFEKVREAGAILAGGHTVQSSEPLFGFAVTGIVQRAHLTTNAGARVGDRLYLTKALGMGCLTTAAKLGRIGWEELRPAAVQMATLNRAAAEAMRGVSARAATDITGFGLLGHASNIARESRVTLRFFAAQLPLFAGALELARARVFSGGMQRGRSNLAAQVYVAPTVDGARADLCFEAETSGGLLICVAPERAAEFEDALRRGQVPVHAVGEAVRQSAHWIELV